MKDAVYEVITKQGGWYKVKAPLERDFIIEGWIHTRFVTEVKAKRSQQKEDEDDTGWEDFTSKKKTEETGFRRPIKKRLVTPKIYERSPGSISLFSGGQIENYSVSETTIGETILSYDIPFSPIVGFNCEGYFINTLRHGFGLDLMYRMSISKFQVTFEDGTTYADKLKTMTHNILVNVKYRFFVTPDKKTFAITPRLGFRFSSMSGDDVLDDDGLERYFFVDASYYGFNLGLLSFKWTLPYFSENTEFGIKGGYDIFLKPSYKEEKNAADGFVTGEGAKTSYLTSFVTGGIFLVVAKHLLLELNYEWSNLSASFGGSSTGMRMENVLTTAKIKDDFHTLMFSIGYRF